LPPFDPLTNLSADGQYPPNTLEIICKRVADNIQDICEQVAEFTNIPRGHLFAIPLMNIKLLFKGKKHLIVLKTIRGSSPTYILVNLNLLRQSL
jgi:hypothetical protein